MQLANTMQNVSDFTFGSIPLMESFTESFTDCLELSLALAFISLMFILFICESLGISLLKNDVPLKSPIFTFLSPECDMGNITKNNSKAAAAAIPALRSHDTFMHIVFSASSSVSVSCPASFADVSSFCPTWSNTVVVIGVGSTFGLCTCVLDADVVDSSAISGCISNELSP